MVHYQRLSAITVCVEYADILALTLPYNRHHFNSFTVVTHPKDKATINVALSNDAKVVTSDLFYKNAKFNKFEPLGEALKNLSDWICILDADIVWPKRVALNLVKGKLYSPRRYVLKTIPSTIPPENYWETLPIHPVGHIWAGYTQIFHSSQLPPIPYPPCEHAGGPDTAFQSNWKPQDKQRFDWLCLHLGPTETNWGGRITPFLDGSLPSLASKRKKALPELLRKHHKEIRKYLK